MHNAAQMHINQKTYYCKRDWWHQTIRQHQGKIWPPSQNPSSPPVVECTSGDRINMSDAFYGNGMAFSKSSTAANKLLCICIMPTVCSHQIFCFAKEIGTKNSKFGRPFGAAFLSKVQANTTTVATVVCSSMAENKNFWVRIFAPK